MSRRHLLQKHDQKEKEDNKKVEKENDLSSTVRYNELMK